MLAYTICITQPKTHAGCVIKAQKRIQSFDQGNSFTHAQAGPADPHLPVLDWPTGIPGKLPVGPGVSGPSCF
ncbi:hypothetical protein XELAEV_18010703mg [Xenopus laevis]|uniref:Uncharacterized protein n=1 Tax=Xenopus laevis TaxID=8355 RepID=A0A974DUN9_XENLA|nr:hypothetical protein XELAEV_18010703mg [Xenopus laevis]